MYHVKASILEQAGEAGWREGQRLEGQTQFSAHHGIRKYSSSEGWVASLLGSPKRSRGTEAAFQPEWPVHIEAELSNRGRVVVQRVVAAME